MNSETVLGVIALIWLVVSFLLMARSISTGRALAEALALRHPKTYEELGRPYPGYFESVRRTRFARFVGQREFEALSDPVLVARFEAHRRSEAKLVVGSVACGAFIALAVFLARQAV